MRTSHLVLGGARSGKSAFAERLALTKAESSGLPLCFLATATADDEEMQSRITRHQQQRDASWQLIEEPIHLARSLQNLSHSSIVVIDCLTLWLSNVLHLEHDRWQQHKLALIDTIQQTDHQLILVSNETGLGITPMGELTRNFVDEIGWLHQDLAKQCDSVTMMVAGLPQKLK